MFVRKRHRKEEEKALPGPAKPESTSTKEYKGTLMLKVTT